MNPRTLADLDRDLDARIRAALATFAVPGAVVAVTHNGVDYVGCFGVRRAGGGDAVDASTAFDIGSCAKSYVATAVGALVSEAQLSFDDPVRRYVPELDLDDPWISNDVRVRDLLCNRTGLARQRPIEAFANPELSLDDIMARMKHIRRVHPFRAGYVYFNLGFMIAARVVERVSSLPYARFMREHVFSPLGMHNSASGSAALQISNRAAGHTRGVDAANLPIADMEFDNTQGAGCLHSSGLDALRWLRLHLKRAGENVLSSRVIDELHRPHTVMPPSELSLMHKPPEASLAAYCLGWWTSELQSRRLVQHAGGMFGWRAQTALAPDHDIGVAVYLNAARNVHHAIAYDVLCTLLDLPGRSWTTLAQQHEADYAAELKSLFSRLYPAPQAGEERPLAAYEGRYTHLAAGDLVVVRDGDGLLAQQMDGRLWDLRLTRLAGDVFEASFARIEVSDYLPVPARVRFCQDAGKIVAFEETSTRYARVTD